MAAYLVPASLTGTIERLKLIPHPEGGYYGVTWVEQKQVVSPYANDVIRSVATCIYYFLSPHVPRGLVSADPVAASMPKGWQPGVGVLHTNKSPTMYLLHHGASRYTLIRAAAPWGPYDPDAEPYKLPEIRTVTMGTDFVAGEVLQLLVEGGWWKVSMLPDSEPARVPAEGMVGLGALISEVVTPGLSPVAAPFVLHTGCRAQSTPS